MGKLWVYSTGKYAAYFPIWYEYVSASFGFTEVDFEWKKLLQERLGVHGEAHEEARAFWTDLHKLSRYPDLDERGREVIERLSQPIEQELSCWD